MQRKQSKHKNGSGSLQAQFESWGAYPDKAETKLWEDTTLKVGSEPYKALRSLLSSGRDCYATR